jgi:hypothetical protein
MVWSQHRQIVHETLSWKYPTQKRAGRVAQVVEHLPSKREAAEFKPHYHPKKKVRKKKCTLLILLSILWAGKWYDVWSLFSHLRP